MQAERVRGPGAARWLPALLALLAAGLVSMVSVESARLTRVSFPGFLVWDNGTLIALQTPSWTGAQAGLDLTRGLLVAVDGSPFESGRELLRFTAGLEPGTPVTYSVRSDGVVRDYTVPTMRLTPGQYASTFAPYLLSAIFFFLISLIALYMRPDLLAARALSGAMGLTALMLTLSVDVLTTYHFVIPCQIAEGTAALAILYLALVFPVERFGVRRRRMAIGGVGSVLAALLALEVSLYESAPELVHQISLGVYALMVSIPLGMLVSFGQTFMRAGDLQERLQAGVVFAGGLAAFLLPAIAVLAFILIDVPFAVPWIIVPLVIFPLALVYAVVRHDLLHAERFIRLSVGYTLSTSSVTLGYALLLSLLRQTVAPGVSASPAATFGLLLALGFSFEPVRRRIQIRVDRVFYRSSLDAGRVLEESSVELASLSDERAIVAYVSERLGSALSVDWAEFSLSGDGRAPASLREPVVFRGELLGHLTCGDKQSGAPFSDSERDLIRGLAGQAALAVRNARTIQALRETQNILVRTERFAAIGELAGAVAHGIRNPLAGIRAAAQIAHEQAGTGPMEEALSGILSEADRLNQRVRTLLDFSRPFEPTLQPTDIGELLLAVRRAVASHAERQGVEIRVELPEEVARLESDPNHLEEAFLELAGNALRSMPDGGVLRLCLESGDAGGALVRVFDTGGGIPPGVRDRVFELFFTTRPDGTGMGLATVKKSIEQLGGTIRLADSGPDGTEFQLELPKSGARVP